MSLKSWPQPVLTLNHVPPEARAARGAFRTSGQWEICPPAHLSGSPLVSPHKHLHSINTAESAGRGLEESAALSAANGIPTLA